jgi:U6 snRNA-associated Sm-like protein LSm8
MSSYLPTLEGKVVSVITNDGRCIIGRLRGNDHVTNIILEECRERVFSLDEPVEIVPLGLYLIRGDNIALIGELDEEADAKFDLSEVRAEAIDCVNH